jgi:CDP-diacylglycerol pyrophosphatase
MAPPANETAASASTAVTTASTDGLQFLLLPFLSVVGALLGFVTSTGNLYLAVPTVNPPDLMKPMNPEP